MTEQIRNDSQVELLSADLVRRSDSTYAWGNAISNHLLIPALHAFWPTSAHHDTHVNVYVDDIACGYDLTLNNTPFFQLWDLGLGPCVRFNIPGSNYLEHADDGQFDILGTEPHVLAAQRGLTLGGWFRWIDRTGTQALMSKWTAVGNQLSYRIYKNAAHNIVFEISNAGAIVDATVTSAGTVGNDIWYHIVGRFVPARTMDIYIDAVRTSAATAVASIFHSNAVTNVARSNATDHFFGYASLMWLSASACWDGAAATRDVIPWALYDHSRRIWNK
jgi:hypothetical protein